jgi:hypothetical protein
VLLGSYASTFAANNIAVGFSDNRSGYIGTYSNFAPRFGFAAQVSNSTVIRAGVGLYYGGVENLGFNGNLAQNYPFEQELAYLSPTCHVNSCGNAGVTLETGFSNATVTPSLALRGGSQHSKTPSYQTFNVNIQREFLQRFTLQAGYVGTSGRHLQVFGPDTDTPAALYTTGSSYQNWITFPGFGGIENIENLATSSYNSLQTVFTMRPSRSIHAAVNYTYSHSLDDGGAGIPQESNGFVYNYRGPDIFGISPDYTNSNFDVRHRVTGRAVYELPFGYGQRFLNRKGLVDRFIGRWSVSPVVQWQTGSPFTFNNDITGIPGGQSHPFIVSNPYVGGGSPNYTNLGSVTSPTVCPATVHTKLHWFNPCALQNPPSALPTNAGLPLDPNGHPYVTGLTALQYLGGKLFTGYGPGFYRIDASISKTYTFTERYSFQFRGSAFNATNHPEWGQPNGSDASVAGATTSGGAITSVRGGPIGGRYLQLDGRFFF